MPKKPRNYLVLCNHTMAKVLLWDTLSPHQPLTCKQGVCDHQTLPGLASTLKDRQHIHISNLNPLEAAYRPNIKLVKVWGDVAT